MFNNTLRQRQNGRSNQKIVFASSFLMYEGEPERDVLIEFLQDSAAVKPLNQELRKNFIINVALSGDFAGGLIDWTWWMLPPFVLLFAACLVLLVRRRWMLLFAAGTFFVRIPLVFLTAPDTYFLYYLTPFIAGYAVTAAGIIYAVMKDKRKRERGHGLMIGLYFVLALVLVLVGHAFRLLRWEQFIRIYERPLRGRCCAVWPAAMR